MDLIIKKEHAQAILNYLSKLPYDQVFQLVNILVNLQEVPKQEMPVEDRKD